MAMHESITRDNVRNACEKPNKIGLCIACGHQQEGVERKQHPICESCGEDKVHAAADILETMAIVEYFTNEGII